MSAPRLVILESPYAGDVERNVAYARRAMSDSLARGEAPIASHLLYTQPGVLDDNAPGERKIGIAAGLAWAKAAEAAVFYVDHGISLGMEAAMAFHRSIGIPVEPRRIGEEPAVETKAAPFPDIGPDPMHGDRSDRMGQSIAICREAYTRQQQGVPPQTALVWRWHLGALIESATRLKALLARNEERAQAVEPFGYWVDQKGAEPALLRKPAYIPEPSETRTVTPLYAQPATNQAREVDVWAALDDRTTVACDAECNGDLGLHDAGCQRATALLNARAALATQPATSQEGEELVKRLQGFICNDDAAIDKALRDAVAYIAATPTPPSQFEDLREALRKEAEDWRHNSYSRVVFAAFAKVPA